MKLFKDKIGQGIGRSSILIGIFLLIMVIVLGWIYWDVVKVAITKLKLLF